MGILLVTEELPYSSKCFRLIYKRIVDNEIEVAKVSPSKLNDLLMKNLIQVLRRTVGKESSEEGVFDYVY